MKVYFIQSMLLSKALQMQQDLEDKKNEIIIEGLESKIKEYEASLEKKDFLLQAVEGSLVEVQAKNIRLNRELLQKSESFEQERKNLQTKYEAEATENTKLKQSLKELRDMCLDFGNRCVQRLKKVLNSVGASAEKFTPSVEDISSTFEHIEGKVEALDKVIAGHGDFYTLLASRGTAAAFLKASCTHAKILNRPNFSLSASDFVGSRFITQIWAKGGRELASDKARSLLKTIRCLYLLLALL
jgi:predicted RNase H-like nuclease (RuvC/YqgF family)